MKSDMYTKVVLTVIASCLVYFVAKDFAPVNRAHAAEDIQTVNAHIIAVGGVGLGGSGALPVRIVK